MPNASIKSSVHHASKPPERFSPLFNDAFLRIFGSSDSAPVTQPLVNAILRAVGMPEIDGIEHISADASLPGGIECKTPDSMSLYSPTMGV